MTTHRAAYAVVITTMALGACGLGAPSSPSSSTTGGASGSSSPSSKGGQVVLLTHDSWAAPKELIAQFQKQTGYQLVVRSNGDAGELTNRMVLSKNAPTGDVVFGIDNTFASRAVQEGVLQDYRPTALPASASAYALQGAGANQLTPIDFGDVCINVDKAWYEKKKQTPPAGLDDLTKPAYKNQLVTPGAPTSSPGMAFLLATIGAKGQDGWQDYWTKLEANGVKITSGWTDAYSVDFSGGEGKGSRPIVLSYSTSPAFTVNKAGTASSTAALLNTCFRQVEYAGVVKGAKNPAGAQAFIDFMLGKDFQAGLPDNMYMYPVDTTVALPAAWKKFATISPKPYAVSPDDIAAHRDQWLKEWADITAG